MNPLTGLGEYLGRVERRVRALTISRGAAAISGAALLFTLLGVLLANFFAFSSGSVLSARMILFLALAAAAGAGLIIPLLRLNARKAAREAESKCPEFEQRLTTFAERAERPDAFLELLAADTLERSRAAGPERIAPKKHIVSFASAGAVALAVLVWLGFSGPGFLGYGTSLLWGAIPHSQQPFYEIQVQPGNHTIRRKSDQAVTARLRGFTTSRVSVFAKFRSSSKWEQAQMHDQPGSSNFEFLFAGVPEAFDYYVEAGGVRSDHYRIDVADLPDVKKLVVTYHYPEWSGLKDKTEDPGGDLRAVEGTEAEVRVETDRPLAEGALLLDDGGRFELRNGVARIPIQKDGAYHVSTSESGDAVRLSDDYFIEAQKAMPPALRIVRPGRDPKVNPIEEVTIAVEAQDDFGVRGMDLHYSVNGGPEKTVALGAAGNKTAQGSATLYLEDYKLIPGDIVSFYATARDARATSRSDIFFIQTQPFEREYSQSQQMGGAGGGQDPNIVSSQYQKDIVAATWNQIKNPAHNKAAEGETARLLADTQTKLRDQAKSIAGRMASRELTGNPAFGSFAQDMRQAADAMGQAADKLRGREWQPALAPEEKALQYLSRAEATMRQIQVAFGQRNGNGGGGARDLEGLFDLELDRERNQFETGRNAASPDQRQKEIEEAMAKLEELARRQQELANQQRQNQQAYQQRWQQEMLQREAEELRRKMEQMARSQQQSMQGQQGQQGRQGQRGQQGQTGQQSQESEPGQVGGEQTAAMNRALERLTEAMRDMRNAQSQGSSQADSEARRAAERLREARQMLSGMEHDKAGREIEDIAGNAQKLAEEQRAFENKMRQALGYNGQEQPGLLQPGTRSQMGQIREGQQKLLDELDKLEKDMQKAARDTAAGQPSASGKLRDALRELESQELGFKMKWSMEVMRRGMGAYALTRQPEITQGLEQLRGRAAEALNAFKREQTSGKDVEAALARAEQLRRDLEQLRNGMNGAKGRQQQEARRGGEGQKGQLAEQSGQGRDGQQPGRDGQPPGGEPGQASNSSSASASSAGSGSASPGAIYGSGRSGPQIAGDRGYGPGLAEREIRDRMQDLSQIGRLLRGSRDLTREQARDILETIRRMEQVGTSRFSTAPDKLDQLLSQLVSGAEQIELDLRRVAEPQDAGSVRSGASQPVPPGYTEAVAEYFKRLSQQK